MNGNNGLRALMCVGLRQNLRGDLMSNANNAAELIARITRKAPEYLDLLTAETDAQFEIAFEAVLEKAVASLERDKKNYKSLSEDGLSGVLVTALSVPGLSATRETHSNGHVDITIEADHCSPMRKKLGEAKIYKGADYHLKGLKQLLGRYTTGREGRGLLIVYFRKQDVAGLVSKLRTKMNSELPHQQDGMTRDHNLRWSFISTHSHSSGEKMEVSHVGCNLYVAD